MAHPGSPGKMAFKTVCACVCVNSVSQYSSRNILVSHSSPLSSPVVNNCSSKRCVFRPGLFLSSLSHCWLTAMSMQAKNAASEVLKCSCGVWVWCYASLGPTNMP